MRANKVGRGHERALNVFRSQRLISRRQAQRRRVAGSAIDWGLCSEGRIAPNRRSGSSIPRPVAGSRSYSGREGGDQSGRIVKVFWHSRATARDESRSSRVPVVCLFSPSPVADDCMVAGTRTPAWQVRQTDLSYPGSDLSSADWQCDKENHGWCEGPPLISLPSFDPATGLHPPVQTSVERKKNNGIVGVALAPPIPNIGRYLATYRYRSCWTSALQDHARPNLSVNN